MAESRISRQPLAPRKNIIRVRPVHPLCARRNERIRRFVTHRVHLSPAGDQPARVTAADPTVTAPTRPAPGRRSGWVRVTCRRLPPHRQQCCSAGYGYSVTSHYVISRPRLVAPLIRAHSAPETGPFTTSTPPRTVRSRWGRQVSPAATRGVRFVPPGRHPSGAGAGPSRWQLVRVRARPRRAPSSWCDQSRPCVRPENGVHTRTAALSKSRPQGLRFMTGAMPSDGMDH